MNPIIGFVPDAAPTTPGAILDCDQLVPFESGMKGAPSTVAVASALSEACLGAVATSDLSGNRRLIAGGDTKLQELSGSSWTDQSRGAGYNLGADDRWSFIQNGNATLAATPTAVIQRSTSGAFADVSGSPQAKILEAASGFVIAFNTSTSSDEWYCSAYLDDTNWTLAVSNQCVKGRLVGGSGPITAARRFGDDVVAYKQGTLFVGRYVGAPVVWQWTQAATDVGCVGQDAVVDTGVGHVFVGRDNVYVFDGTYPRPVADGLRKWLFSDMSPTYQSKTTLLWDRVNRLVWIFYPSAGSSGTLDRCVVWHMDTNRWGVAHRSIEAVVTYRSPALTYDGGSSLVTTYDTGPSLTFDALYWISGNAVPAVFNASHVLSTLTGAASDAYFVTWDFGDDEGNTHCDVVRVRYSTAPTTSTVTGYFKAKEGTSPSQAVTSTESDGKHDMRQTGRFHRFRVETTGDFQVTGVRPNLKPAGRR